MICFLLIRSLGGLIGYFATTHPGGHVIEKTLSDGAAGYSTGFESN